MQVSPELIENLGGVSGEILNNIGLATSYKFITAPVNVVIISSTPHHQSNRAVQIIHQAKPAGDTPEQRRSATSPAPQQAKAAGNDSDGLIQQQVAM